MVALEPTIRAGKRWGSVPLTAEEWGAWRGGAFELHCPRMVLRTPDDSVCYEGGGSIYQAPHQGIAFRLYGVGTPRNSTPWCSVVALEQGASSIPRICLGSRRETSVVGSGPGEACTMARGQGCFRRRP